VLDAIAGLRLVLREKTSYQVAGVVIRK